MNDLGYLRTADAALRAGANLAPELSLAWHGAAFFGSGWYSDFKRVRAPRAPARGQRFERLDDAIAYDADSATYRVNAPGGAFAFADPDFNWRTWRSNVVLRWEYRPGSALYLVWTQNRDSDERARAFALGDEFGTLFRSHPNDTILVKASYWFSL